MLFMSCFCYAFASFHCCLVVTCRERAGLLFLMLNCVFDTFPCGILGQVWYLVVSILDLCRLSYFSWHCFMTNFMRGFRKVCQLRHRFFCCCIFGLGDRIQTNTTINVQSWLFCRRAEDSYLCSLVIFQGIRTSIIPIFV